MNSPYEVANDCSDVVGSVGETSRAAHDDLNGREEQLVRRALYQRVIYRCTDSMIEGARSTCSQQYSCNRSTCLAGEQHRYWRMAETE